MNAREISSLVFGRARKGTLVCLRVYFDGAGKEDDHAVITVGGFLATSEICEEMEAEWEAATEGKQFHYTDFGTEYCKLGSAGWTSEERVGFLKRLASIVNRKDAYILGASLEVATFNEVLFGAQHPQELGPAFSACAYAAILNIEALLKDEQRNKQKVVYTFEKGDRQHEINKTFADWDSKNSEFRNLRGCAFLSKESTPLLQPADFVAGAIQRCVISAVTAFPSLDNGLARTRLQTFDRHYSGDGVTTALVSGHDTKRCWVVNAKSFNFLDKLGVDFFTKHPDKLEKSMKHAPFKPKAKPTVQKMDSVK